jgi:starch phosphorylase
MGKAKSGTTAHPAATGTANLLERYGCGPVAFTGKDDALYERRLVFDHVIDAKAAGPREQFEAVSAAIRDVLAQRWVKTNQHYDKTNPKQVYYLSMEFLIGRSLGNNIANLLLSPVPSPSRRRRD